LILRNIPDDRKLQSQRRKILNSGYSITLENLKVELKSVIQIFVVVVVVVKHKYKDDAKFVGT
jgi:hypothetical protein